VQAIQFLEDDPKLPKSEKPFFLTVYIPDPHHPYDDHAIGIDAFGSGTQARYDEEIAFSDRHIGFLAEYLIYNDLWDDTIFIVTSDHGEEFGEHEGKKHARTCYHESTHVPLLVHIPGIEPQRIDDFVALTDVVPTIAELVGLPLAEAELDGQSLLVPTLTPAQTPTDRRVYCSVISQRAKQGNFFRRAVRSGKWLLVHELIEGTYELYDTQADPEEQRNVYDRMADEPEIKQLRGALNQRLTGNLAERLLTD
jgi:arylsulfatase A-like enzyme